MSPQLRAQFEWLSKAAPQHFPRVIRAIEYKSPIPQEELDWITLQLLGAAAIYDARTQMEAA
jgi:hypothetical protein